MKQILTLIALLFAVIANGQPDMNDNEILETYWKYRNNLRNNFLKVGSGFGESIPASARRIGYLDSAGPDQPSSMWWGDGTITLSNYIMVLATELKLLQNQGEDTNPTAVELYYALNAINRLDLRAESYLSENSVPNSINGLLLRDDVNELILDNFQNDYSVVFDRPANIQRVSSDFYQHDATANDKKNVQSLDQLVAIVIACQTVKLLLEWEYAYLPNGTGHNLGQMSIDIVNRINTRLEAHEWAIYTYNGKNHTDSPAIVDHYEPNNLGTLAQRGNFVLGNLPAFKESYKYMTFNYGGFVYDSSNNDKIPVVQHTYMKYAIKEDMYDELNIALDASDVTYEDIWNIIFPILSPTEEFNLNQTTWADGFNITENNTTTVQMTEIYEFLEKGIEDETIVFNDDLDQFFERPNVKLASYVGLYPHLKLKEEQLTRLWYDLGHEYKLPLWKNENNNGGLTMDDLCDLPTELITSRLYGTASPSLVANVFDRLFHLKPGIGVIHTLQNNACASSKFNDIDIELITKGDNVRISLETAVMANIWPADYVSEVAVKNGMYQYPLLQAVLFNDGNLNNFVLADVNMNTMRNILKTAPCEGPWASPWTPEGTNWQDTPVAPGGWASRDRLSHPGGKDHGAWSYDNDVATGINSGFRGEYPGLDFMLYYNLYQLCFGELIDVPYVKNTSCNCVEQITYAEELTEDLVVGAKFESYRAMGIKSPSFLSHDLLISGADLTIANELVLCNGYEDDYTELTIGNGSNMLCSSATADQTYTITANEYTRIVIENNAFFLTNNTTNGIKLVLKSGSELIVRSGGILDFIKNDALIIEEGAQLIIEDGGIATFENYQEVNNEGLINIEDNAQLNILASDNNFVNEHSIEIHGELIIDAGTLENHSYLKGYNTLTIINDGILDIKEDAHYGYYPTSTLTLEGDGSIINIEGDIRVRENAELTIEHPTDVSGRINGVPHGGALGGRIVMANGSSGKVNLIGDNDDDLLITGKLSIAVYDCKLSDCLVQSQLTFNNTTKTECTNVDFEDHELYSARNCKLVDCDFEDNNAIVENMNATASLYGYNSTFNRSQVWVGGNFSMNNCDFSNVVSDNFYHHYNDELDFYALFYANGIKTYSVLNNCTFNAGNANPGYAKVGFYAHKSNVTIHIKNSSFNDFDYGIIKYTNGGVRLKCNEISDNEVGVQVGKYVSLYLDVPHASGYNTFSDNQTAIRLDRAKQLELNDGYNNFSNNYPDMLFEGTIISSITNPCITDQSCAGTYSLPYEMNRNYWKNSNFGGLGLNTNTPDQNVANPVLYDLSYYDVCGGGSTQNCSLEISDHSPMGNVACGIYDKVTFPIKKENKKNLLVADNGKPNAVQGQNKDNEDPGNPLINTFNFSGIPLDSALVYSVTQMTEYDSINGNNELAVDLLHEVLTSGLDRSNYDVRYRMDMAQDFMKIAVETLFNDGIIPDSSNIYSFHPLSQKYVDVLNVLTDTLVSDSTYREQFYLEIDKAHFFRLIDNPEMSYQLAGQIGACDIDLLEQSLVNDWLKSLQQDMYPDSLLNDSIPFVADTTLFTVPTVLHTNEFYFGSILVSPNSIVYNPCQVSFKDFKVTDNGGNFNIYPNPNAGQFIIKNNGEATNVELRLLTERGELIFQRSKYFDNSEEWYLDLEKPARGIYNLQIISNKNIENHKLIIQ